MHTQATSAGAGDSSFTTAPNPRSAVGGPTFDWSEEMRHIAADIGVLIQRAKSAGHSELTNQAEALGKRIERAREGASELAGQAAGQMNDMLDALESQVRAKPLPAVGLALLVGALLGVLACRR